MRFAIVYNIRGSAEGTSGGGGGGAARVRNVPSGFLRPKESDEVEVQPDGSSIVIVTIRED